MPSLIPVTINVSTGDSAYITNDPFFPSVVLLLHGDGAGTAVVDSALPPNAMTGNISQTATTPKFGTASLLQDSATYPAKHTQTPLGAQGGQLDILSGTADFTIDGWFWQDVGGSSLTIMSYGDDATAELHGLLLQVDSAGSLRLLTSITDSISGQAWKSGSTASGIATSTWHHFAIVRSNGVPLFFLDGVLQSLAIGSSNWTHYAFPNTSPIVVFGTSSTIAGGSGTGKFDELRVTKGVARWITNFTPPTAAVVAYPLRRGYSDGGVIGIPIYGSSNPSPAELDLDIAAIISDVNTGTATAPVFNFQVAIQSQQGSPIFQEDLTGVSFVDQNSVQQNLLANAATFTTEDGGATAIWTWSASKEYLAFNSTTAFTFLFEDPNTDFNCNCEITSPYKTLAEVRRKMLIRLGYPNQLTNPPPGMATLVDQFLGDAQDEIYRQLQRAALWTERFYRWTMVPGQRYYGFDQNNEPCDAQIDPYKITWVGFEDLNRAWYRLDEGIPPEYYTRANINFGWPTRFEIRSCIEIFPAPQAAYTLWVKGDFPPAPLVQDTDKFTIDDVAVFLLALGNAKAHYGQKDAQLVLTQAGNYSKALVAGTHGTKRYVNRSGQGNPLTPPKFLPLGNEPS